MSDAAQPNSPAVGMEKDLHDEKGRHIREIVLNKDGFPLAPQPSTRKDDPLNWSRSMKLFVLLQVSWLTFLGQMAAAVPNPAFVALSEHFRMPIVNVSYELTVYIFVAGAAPLLITPISNVYGRRPIYLIGNAIGASMNVIAGNTDSWTSILVTRVFAGIGTGSTIAIGAATVCDMFFLHERGFYMGIYTYFLTNGPHFAPLMGGFLGQYVNWESCFAIPGYIQLGTLVFTVFFLPETLYHRDLDQSSGSREYKERSFKDLLLFRRQPGDKTVVKPLSFLKPFYMLKYVAIVLPCIYYMTCFGYGTVLFALTGASLFAEFYHFNLWQTGLMLSIPLLIGCFIGEANAGWLTDWMVRRHARRNDGHVKPEARLNAVWFGLLIPVGIIIEGVCLSHHESAHWIGSALGMGITSLGLQAATTVIYAYTTDCYKPQSAHISALLNVFRQFFAAVVSFYALPLAEKINIENAWIVLAMINIATFLPMLLLRKYGEKWRKESWQSPPEADDI